MTKRSSSPGLISLGFTSSPGGQEALVDLLLACHARIRHFARLAFTVGARPELPAAEVKAATAHCLRYFLEALPLHVRDEEDSVLPRLTGRSPGLDATLAQIRAQHFAHEGRLDSLVGALRAVHGRPNEVQLHRQLSATASRVETDLLEHLRLEEGQVFCLLETALTEDQQEDIVAGAQSPPAAAGLRSYESKPGAHNLRSAR